MTDATFILGRLINELPSKRDWLDPVLEKAARACIDNAAKTGGQLPVTHGQLMSMLQAVEQINLAVFKMFSPVRGTNDNAIAMLLIAEAAIVQAKQLQQGVKSLTSTINAIADVQP